MNEQNKRDATTTTAESQKGIQFPVLEKRELFAAMAMQATLQSNWCRPGSDVASKAVKYADDLIAELSKEQP